MAMVKVKKANTNEVHEAKKVAKLVAVELGSAKKLPKKPKSKREKTSGPPNLGSADGGA
jgi:hypothetical protein